MKMTLRKLLVRFCTFALEGMPVARASTAIGLSAAVVMLVGQTAARGEVTVDAVGAPAFQVVDTHVYAAADDSFPNLFPSHFPMRMAHGSFDQEYADGLALTGYPEKEVFSVAEFTAPSAIHLGFVVVPGANATMGSSQDFASGPIMPNDILPIAVHGDVYLNGNLFEQDAFGFNLTPIANFDGRSHFLVNTYENSAFAPAGLESLVGDYEYRLTLRDVNDNGYNVVAKFATVPEPGNLFSFALCGALMLASFVRQRGAL